MLEYLQRRFGWRRVVSNLGDSEVSFGLFLGELEVGTLRIEGSEWIFSYSEAFKNQSKVSPIIDFPQFDQKYRSTRLWPFFALRVPSLAQANVREFLAKTKEEPNDALLLEEFGRRSIANPFVLEPTLAR